MTAENAKRPLNDIIAEVVSDHELDGVGVRTDSIEEIGNGYSLTVIWNFSTVIPTFKYDESRVQSIVDGEEVTVSFRSANVSPDRWVVEEIPYEPLTRYEPENREDIDLSPLKQLLSETTIDVETIENMISGDEDGPPIISLATLGLTNERAASPTRLHLDMELNGPHHCPLGEFSSLNRFVHVNSIRVGNSTYPVKITISEMEGLDPSDAMLVYCSEQMADWSDITPRPLSETMKEVDLNEAVHTGVISGLTHGLLRGRVNYRALLSR